MAEIDYKERLTFHQLQMWMAQQRFGKSALDNLTFSYRLPSKIQPELFARAYGQLMKEADCFRMSLGEENAEPIQIIYQESSHQLKFLDFSQERSPWESFTGWVKAWAERPVDLDELVLNSALVVVDANTTCWVITIHHIVADAWGLFTIYQRLTEIYSAYQQGLQPGPSKLVSLQEQAKIDAAYRETPEFRADEIYWAEKFLTLPDALLIYGYNGRGKQAASHRVNCSVASHQVRNYVRRERPAEFLWPTDHAAIFHVFLAIYAVYLQRVSSSQWFSIDVAPLNVLTPDSGEPHGIAVQIVPLFIRIEQDDTFRTIQQKIWRELQEIVPHRRYPILNRNQQTQTVAFNLHNRGMAPGGDPVETEWHSGANTDDVSLSVFNPDLDRDQIDFGFDLPVDLLKCVPEDQICEHFLYVLQQCLDEPDQPIRRVRLLTNEAARRLITVWNPPVVEPLPSVGVHHLIETWAVRSPTAPAVFFEDQVLSYKELNSRANRLARWLVRQGVPPGTLVGVCLERSLDLVVTILAVLKAGGVYLPLDPAYPKDRLAEIIGEASLEWIITMGRLKERLPDTRHQPVDLQAMAPQIHKELAENLSVAFSSSDLVYVIFTSGSTGRPKGVMIEHRNLVNYLTDLGQNWQVGPEDVSAQISSLNFDLSIEEIFLPLTHGGALVLRTQNFLDSIPNFLAECQRYGVSLLVAPTGFWNELVTQMEMFDLQPPDRLRLVDVGGERQRPDRVALWLARTGGKIRTFNGYGPTETTVASTFYEIEGPPERWRQGEEVPIGRPGRNQSAYVLDADLQPVPVGVLGELFIGGVGVGRGYLNQPDLTAERFLPDPFSALVGARMYRTGDLARQRADGILEFWGRVDQQVKLRGYRIELGEIETILTVHPRVKQALVLVRENHAGDKYLVAYVILTHGAEAEVDLRAYLREKLPEFMIPAAFIQLDHLPLTPNGKLDESALPDPLKNGPAAAGLAPQSVLEAQLAVIWQEVLGVSGVAPDQDFFGLGGNSLLGIRLFAEIEKKLKVRLSVAELFRFPTVQKLAQAIYNSGTHLIWSPVVLVQPGGPGQPLFIVHGWGGGVIGYAPLARELGTHWPIYGLQAAGLIGEQAADQTVADMAARYVQAMKTIQPHGPYRLAGYCAGGEIAYEMACLLAEQGEETHLVAMIEAYSPGTIEKSATLLSPVRWFTILKNIPYWYSEYRGIGWFGIRQRVIKIVRSMQQRRRRENDPQMKFLLDDVVLEEKGVLPDRQMELLRLHLDAFEVYHPRPYPGKVVVFAAKGLTVSQAFFESLDASLGWKKLARGGVKTHSVAGGHRNLHQPPYVTSLAAALRSELLLLDKNTK